MPLMLMLALQAAAQQPTPPAPPLLDIDFDLATFDPPTLGLAGRCRREGDAITVCGRRGGGAYPLAEMARIFEPGRLVAEMRVAGDLTGNVSVSSVPMDRGAVSKRVMVGLRLPF